MAIYLSGTWDRAGQGEADTVPRGAGGLGTAGGTSPASPRPPLQCCRASRCRRWPSGWRARRTPCVSCGPPAGSSGLASTPALSAAEPPQQRRSPNIYRPRPAPPWQRHPQGTRGPACPCRAPSGKGKGLQGRAPAPALPPPGTEGALPSMSSSNQVLENCHRNHIPGVAGADGRHGPSPAQPQQCLGSGTSPTPGGTGGTGVPVPPTRHLCPTKGLCHVEHLA